MLCQWKSVRCLTRSLGTEEVLLGSLRRNPTQIPAPFASADVELLGWPSIVGRTGAHFGHFLLLPHSQGYLPSESASEGEEGVARHPLGAWEGALAEERHGGEERGREQEQAREIAEGGRGSVGSPRHPPPLGAEGGLRRFVSSRLPL